MSRYLGSIYSRSRRLKFSLLENNKEFSKGKKRVSPPGQHGAKRAVKPSNYGQQLIEKQKIKFLYDINDTQFRRLFHVAQKMDGMLSMNLFRVLESRLDNLVFRMGFAPTRRSARQLVNHGHITVDGKVTDIASTLVPIGGVISLKENAKKIPLVVDSVGRTTKSKFVDVNSKTLSGIFVRYPERDELPREVNESYVVEWYKRLV